MKKSTLLAVMMLFVAIVATAAKPKIAYTPGKDLTLIGKLMETPDRYARVDTVKYTGFDKYQRTRLNQESAGLALVFKTNSDAVWVKYDFKYRHHAANGTDIASAGADLYIRRNGKWLYAGSAAPNGKNDPFELVANMAPGEKECLLYLPLRSIVNEVEVGVTEGSKIEPMANPFRHKVVFWGSSFTHGVSANRSGMAYPLQFQRATGFDVRSLGVSGNSKLQQSYARVLADTPADIFVFDSFSNPTPEEIRENFEPFLKTLRAAHPKTPIIFQHTIYRGNRNFNTRIDSIEVAKRAVVEELVGKAMKTDPNIYLISPDADPLGETCTDKTHPSDWGYYNWMESIRQPIVKIMKKYNMK